MAKELFDLGFSGPTRSQGFEEDGQLILTEEMPSAFVRELLEFNRKQQESFNAKLKKGGSVGGIAARIPITEHLKWKREWKATGKQWGVPWQNFLKFKLNGTNYKKLRFAKL